jgi:hypothetical protein
MCDVSGSWRLSGDARRHNCRIRHKSRALVWTREADPSAWAALLAEASVEWRIRRCWPALTFRFHDLRHAFVTLTLFDGESLNVVQKARRECRVFSFVLCFTCKSRQKGEPTSGLEPLACSLRVIGRALQGVAQGCKSRTSKPLSLLCLALCCTVLRSRWCQNGVTEMFMSIARVGDSRMIAACTVVDSRTGG